ncbi:hypothetical protein FACS1894113_4400 [Alphaproteobacteria bacterium]|nr:hypothetical protein FACS1894113_4400 [Alphaproteobacteria bacterium]
MSLKALKGQILKILDEKKLENIVEIDTSLFNRFSEICIIASGTSLRHMHAIADFLLRFLKSEKLHAIIEKTDSWVLIEACGIEIHLFKPEMREYYALEKLLTFNEEK